MAMMVGATVACLVTTSCFYVYQPPAGPRPQTEPPPPEKLSDMKPELQETPVPEPEAPLPPRPKPPVAQNLPVARKVPGRDGFVFSPFNNKMLDVKGVPSGTKVRDPNFPESERKYFLVP